LNVIVDTSVWSLVLRRGELRLNLQQRAAADELREIINEGRVRLLGLVRQEILSGIRSPAQFDELRTNLRSFPDIALELSDYETAAASSNTCRSKGVTVSVIDVLIATVAITRGWTLFTQDSDFDHISRILPLQIHTIR
jgi:predicted nucleic acid-binding protein